MPVANYTTPGIIINYYGDESDATIHVNGSELGTIDRKNVERLRDQLNSVLERMPKSITKQITLTEDEWKILTDSRANTLWVKIKKQI